MTAAATPTSGRSAPGEKPTTARGGAVLSMSLCVAMLLALWGVMNTAMSIGWMSWLSQNVGDDAEAAGSLMVAAIQGAILLGGELGGTLLDHFGIGATFAASVALSGIAAMAIGSGRSLLNASSRTAEA